jgi:hypothetical protein
MADDCADPNMAMCIKTGRSGADSGKFSSSDADHESMLRLLYLKNLNRSLCKLIAQEACRDHPQRKGPRIPCSDAPEEVCGSYDPSAQRELSQKFE